jgi:hypothetical protein
LTSGTDEAPWRKNTANTSNVSATAHDDDGGATGGATSGEGAAIGGSQGGGSLANIESEPSGG